MQKFSNLEGRYEATNKVFEEEIWPKLATQYEGLPSQFLANIKEAFRGNMHKEMAKKFGRSKYIPHQSTREMTRRLKNV